MSYCMCEPMCHRWACEHGIHTECGPMCRWKCCEPGPSTRAQTRTRAKVKARPRQDYITLWKFTCVDDETFWKVTGNMSPSPRVRYFLSLQILAFHAQHQRQLKRQHTIPQHCHHLFFFFWCNQEAHGTHRERKCGDLAATVADAVLRPDGRRTGLHGGAPCELLFKVLHLVRAMEHEVVGAMCQNHAPPCVHLHCTLGNEEGKWLLQGQSHTAGCEMVSAQASHKNGCFVHTATTEM